MDKNQTEKILQTVGQKRRWPRGFRAEWAPDSRGHWSLTSTSGVFNTIHGRIQVLHVVASSFEMDFPHFNSPLIKEERYMPIEIIAILKKGGK